MSKVLYIVANPSTEEASYSLSIGRSFLNAYKSNNSMDEIIELDLYNMMIPLIDSDVLNAWELLRSHTSFDTLSAIQQQKLESIHTLTDQFAAADKYVVVSPLWNLSIPPMLKAYIDTVVIADKTFTYTANGPEGLLKGKKGIHIQARGGTYSGDKSFLEFGDSYLRTIMSFLGIDMMESIIAEGMAYSPEKADEIKLAAIYLSQSAAKVMASV